jgi:hypothetical protein
MKNIFIGGILILGPLLFSLYKNIEEYPFFSTWYVFNFLD